jgi:ABC-type Fe3+ transport system permease subunit
LFAFGILTNRVINDRLALIVCLVAPLLILGIDFINNIDWWQKQLKLEGAWVADAKNLSTSLFGTFKIGTELLIYNGILTFLGLWIISKKEPIAADVKKIFSDAHR